MMGRWLFRLILALIFIFLIGPLAMVVITSFSAQSPLIFPPKSLTLRWYQEIPREFYQALVVSLKVALLTTIVAVAVAVPAAVALMRTPLPAKRLISAIVLAPLTVPSLIIGVAVFQAALVFWDMTGLSFDGTLTILVFGHLTFAIPLVIRSVVASYSQFDDSIEEAAQSLGAHPVKVFFKVTLPVLSQGIASGAVFAFFMSLDDVPIALFLSSGQNTTLPVRIFSTIEFSFSTAIMTISSIIIVASMLVLLIVDRVVGLERVLGSKA
jgi:putative spermidine/putrescine transport system permease protein